MENIKILVEDIRTDENNNKFYVCTLEKGNSINVDNKINFLYESIFIEAKEKILTIYPIDIKIEKIISHKGESLENVFRGHRGGFYFSGTGLDMIEIRMKLTDTEPSRDDFL